jgi:thiamine-phosphate pyrophosphorylase
MIISMSDVICITNRMLTGDNFLLQIEKIAAAGPRAIIVREKDLSEHAYERMAALVLNICRKHDVRCILHTFAQVSITLQADGIHLPLHELKRLNGEDRKKLNIIGTSVHSICEAVEAQDLGVNYIIAGHIFETNCKRELPPRGLGFLKEVCNSVTVPVYAIGGISRNNAPECIKSGASGVCIMSALMECEDPVLII